MTIKYDDYIKQPYLVETLSVHQAIELYRCQTDPIYMAKNYIKVKHPTKGLIPFALFDYQEHMIRSYTKYKDVVTMTGRQQGKTETAAMFLLHYTTFNDAKTVLVAANKFKQAMEILDRVRTMYKELPIWLKKGILTFNKSEIEFENGSRIVARATTPDAGRGLSVSLLYCDEFAFVQPRMASEFYTAIYPTLSTGGKCIITSTPNSNEDQYAQIYLGAIDNIDKNGFEIPDGVGKNGFYPITVPWYKHPERDEVWADNQRSKLGDIRFRREFNCEFIQSDETLIHPLLLSRLTGVTPLFTQNEVIRWYKQPEPNMTYIAGMDPAMGTGGDCAAIQIFELPDMVQVAEWKCNETPIRNQIKILKQMLDHVYNTMVMSGEQVGEPEIYWSVENNSLGEAALIVIDDTGEEQIPGTFIHEPKKSGGGGKGAKRRRGLNTNHKNKLASASRLKSLLETQRMTILSKALISELKNYVSTATRTGGSTITYRAKLGTTDDLIAATLIAIRVMNIIANYDPDFNETLKESIGAEIEDIEPLPMAFL